MFNVNKLNQDEKFALLIGILIGDGCLSRYVTKKGRTHFAISIVCNYHDDIPFFKRVVAPLINSLREGMKPVRIIERPKKSTVEILFSDKGFFHRINSIGFPIGKKGASIEIPKIFYEKSLLKYIVQGFFATDGSLVLTKNPNKFCPRVEGTGISKKLISQICFHLNEGGMRGYFYIAKRNKMNHFGETRQQPYRFQFNGKNNLLLFKRLIGFVNPKHEKKFLDFINYNLRYDHMLKDNGFSKQKILREKINSKFIEKMATPRVELGTSSCPKSEIFEQIK